MKPLSFVVVSGRDEFKKNLLKTGRVEVASVLTDPTEIHDAVERCQPDVVLLDVAEDATIPLDQFEKLAVPRPLLMMAGPQEDTSLMLRALRMGARDFFPPDPSEAELRTAVERVLLDRADTSRNDRPAPVVAVLGAKGGVGATMVACQLAGELQKLGGRVAIADLHLKLGDVALYYDLQPHYTLASLATDGEEIDAAYMNTLLEAHASGVKVLASPARVEEAELINARSLHLQSALDVLRTGFDWVVVDTPGSWDETTMMLLDKADRILLVTLMDVPSLHHARQHLDLIQRLGHPKEKVRLIANRASDGAAVSKADFAAFLDREADVLIPDDHAATTRSVNEGKLLWQLTERGALRKGFAGLATRLHEWCGVELALPPEKNGADLLGRLTRRFKRGAN